MSHASSAPLRMTEMRERHLSLKRGGTRRAEAVLSVDDLLWSSKETQDKSDKLLWMEDGVEKDAPDMVEPTRTWLEESSEWTGLSGAPGSAGNAEDGGEDPAPPNTLVWL